MIALSTIFSIINKLKDIMWATDKNVKMMNQLEMEKN